MAEPVSVANEFIKYIPVGIGTLVSVIISSLWVTFLHFREKKQDKLSELNQELNEILQISIQYPYLESKAYCDNWNHLDPNIHSDEKALRYYNFTTLVFNYLSKLSAHCKYDDECIQKNHINMKSWIRLHKKAWENPLNDPNENIDSYDAKFVSLVNKCLGKN
ncbi:hypothetical protein N5I80_07180 [Acinetobacter junii]|uniref:hypothetical protein n=1 Tax=Acinetobacter TaxID=469 RepID=UPI0014392AB8|nr:MULTISPECIES: hypothetical protein [Acinetobacter]MCH7312644.1 hypothetical protein [Acinetobacter sp. ANC 4805]MDH1376332.1 hypothetical protein [Acinetobacter junii]NKG34424.1 hypothetical protein [Acinetobacter junii]